MVQGETCFFHGVSEGHGLEVAAVVDLGGGRVDEGVVGCWVSEKCEFDSYEGSGWEWAYWSYTPESPSRAQLGYPRSAAQ
jgi:hypothetical protein